MAMKTRKHTIGGINGHVVADVTNLVCGDGDGGVTFVPRRRIRGAERQVYKFIDALDKALLINRAWVRKLDADDYDTPCLYSEECEDSFTVFMEFKKGVRFGFPFPKSARDLKREARLKGE